MSHLRLSLLRQEEPILIVTSVYRTLLHLTHAANIHKQLHKAGLRQRGESGQLPTCEVEDPSGSSYLSMPDGVGGVTDDSRPSLLPMVGTGGETAFLSWLNGHLKVRVRIEEHSFL